MRFSHRPRLVLAAALVAAVSACSTTAPPEPSTTSVPQLPSPDWAEVDARLVEVFSGVERDFAGGSFPEVSQRAAAAISEAASSAPAWFFAFVEAAAAALDGASDAESVSELAPFSRVLPAARIARLIDDLQGFDLPAGFAATLDEVRAELEGAAADGDPLGVLPPGRVAELHAALVLAAERHRPAASPDLSVPSETSLPAATDTSP